MSIQKQASTTAARPGEAVTFTLLAQNTGSEIARDVVVTDRVPDVFTITDLKSTKGDVTVNGQTVSAYPVTLAPAERVTITITTRVRADAQAGEYRNIGLITTSTPGDTPENNTNTVTVTIAGGAPVKPSPTTQAFVPSRIPSTADPDLPTFAMIWGPWVMLAMMLIMFGSMVRFGMLRTRFVSVGLRTPLAVPVKATHTTILSVELDVAAVLTAWRAGTSLRDLTQQVALENPQANSVMVGLAVQQLIREQIGS